MPKEMNLDENEQGVVALIQKNQTPAYRQAYSDRTSWLMAMLSELAYQPLDNIDSKCAEIFSLGASKNYKTSVEKTYDHNGTQAFLLSTTQFLVLVFRGTEANCLKDIKSDINAAKTRRSTTGNIHSGFDQAFEQVADAIQNDLNTKKHDKKPLLITGHSLGGALAIIASKRLRHRGGIASCYTFGSPRVGDEKWSYDIKVPIYRVVNAVDCVTILPPSNIIILPMKLLAGFIPLVGRKLQKRISKFEGYVDFGDMRYLTDCKPNGYDKVELLHNVSFLRRVRAFLRSKSAAKFIKDHSILVYRKKLAIVAIRRNQPI